MDFVIAQILGIIALIIVAISYFLKSKSRFLMMQVVANFFYASSFFVLGAYVGAGIVAISIFRCIYLYFAEKYSFKYTRQYLLIFIALYIVMTIVFWKNAFDIMPLFTSITFTLAYTIKDLQLMRWVLIIPNSVLVVYNILTRTYSNALLDLMEVIVIILSIIKFRKLKTVNLNTEVAVNSGKTH